VPGSLANPRWPVHYTPTSASWLNQIERSPLLTETQLRRGIYSSARRLQADILAYIHAISADPKPFRWAKATDDILAAIQRFLPRPPRLANAQQQIARTSEIAGH
jgi:hypothetical protein